MILTPKQRVVFRMARQSVPQKEIARTLRMSEPAVSRLRSRAEQRVRELLKACGGVGGECGAIEALLA